MMVSFVLSVFPRDVLDEILNLIESVSEDFPSYSLKGDWTDEKLVKVQQVKISLTLNIFKRKQHPRCLLNDDANSNRLICVFLWPLSLKPGKTSTKSSGPSPRTISRRIVDTGNPKPTIPAGGIRRPS